MKNTLSTQIPKKIKDKKKTLPKRYENPFDLFLRSMVIMKQIVITLQIYFAICFTNFYPKN